MSTRALLTLLVGALAVGALIGAQTCPREAAGQFVPGTAPYPYPFPTQEQLNINAGHAKAVEHLYKMLYEGYLTRPGYEREEDEKFMRGLRAARVARQRAQTLLYLEPWHLITPIPGQDPGPTTPPTAAAPVREWRAPILTE